MSGGPGPGVRQRCPVSLTAVVVSMLAQPREEAQAQELDDVAVIFPALQSYFCFVQSSSRNLTVPTLAYLPAIQTDSSCRCGSLSLYNVRIPTGTYLRLSTVMCDSWLDNRSSRYPDEASLFPQTRTLHLHLHLSHNRFDLLRGVPASPTCRMPRSHPSLMAQRPRPIPQ